MAKEAEPDLILYDPERDDVHVLNATACLVYRMHREGREVCEIVKAVKDQFQTEEGEDVGEDVRNCLDELKRKGLIHQ